MTKILVLDNYDSFVYTLNGYLQQLGAETDVIRNDAIEASELSALMAKESAGGANYWNHRFAKPQNHRRSTKYGNQIKNQKPDGPEHRFDYSAENIDGVGVQQDMPEAIGRMNKSCGNHSPRFDNRQQRCIKKCRGEGGAWNHLQKPNDQIDHYQREGHSRLIRFQSGHLGLELNGFYRN